MIAESKLRQLLDEKAAGTPHFVVDLAINSGNIIMLELDGDNGLTIEDIMSFSRYVEHDVLDRDEEDFELQVTSPGLDRPFKVWRQYKKNVGRNVKVKTDEGKLEGLLKTVEEDHIVVETRVKERVEGRKKKEWVITEHRLTFEQIQETKVVISFK